MKSKRLLSMIISGWFLSLIVVMGIYGSFGFEHNLILSKITTLLLLTIDIFVLIFAISTFAYFFSRARRIHTEEYAANISARERDIFVMKKFRVPFLMVSTYILFNVSGTVSVISLYYYERGFIGMLLYHILTFFGFASDAFIYVYLQKNVWELFLTMIGKSNQVNTTTVDEPDV